MKAIRFPFLILFYFLFVGGVFGHPLSDSAKISLLTCSPGAELYSIFGHSAVWIYDPATQTDEVYGYGTFDFNTDNFYLKFVRGKLMYSLDVSSYRGFQRQYEYEQRSVKEQELVLTSAEKQQLYNELLLNIRPENREYKYDFFFDNCATRIRDLLERVESNKLKWQPAQDDKTYRDLLHEYLRPSPWAEIGIDLVIGSKADAKADTRQRMFLPDYLSNGFENAMLSGKKMVAPAKNKLSYPPAALPDAGVLPWSIFSFLLLLHIYTLFQPADSKMRYTLDGISFFVAGLLGLVMTLLWLGTDHQATYNNYNVFWALPFHLIAAFQLKKVGESKIWKNYFRIASVLGVLTFVFLFAGIQIPPIHVLPFILALVVKCGMYGWRKEVSA